MIVLSWFGVTSLLQALVPHGEAVGIAVTPKVAVAYGVVAVFLYALSPIRRWPAQAT